MNTETIWVIGATAVIAMFAGWACICRMNSMHPRFVNLRIRARYVTLFMTCGSVALSPVLAIYGPLITAVGLLAFLGLGSKDWSFGVPANLRTDWGDLDTKPMDLDQRELSHVSGGSKK